LEERLFLVRLELAARCRNAMLRIRERLGLRRSSLVLPEIVGSRIASDLIHPRDEAICFLISVAVFQNPDKHVLNKVFADHAASGKPAEEVVERLAIALEEDFQLIEIALADGHHDRFVGPVHRHHR